MSENAAAEITVPFHRTSSEHALIVKLIAEIERRNDEFRKNRSRILERECKNCRCLGRAFVCGRTHAFGMKGGARSARLGSVRGVGLDGFAEGGECCP
jgi:hypothetical protein